MSAACGSSAGSATPRKPRRASRVHAADALHPRNLVANVGESRVGLSSRSTAKTAAPYTIEKIKRSNGQFINVFAALVHNDAHGHAVREANYGDLCRRKELYQDAPFF